MPILEELVARYPARFAEPQPCFDAAFVLRRRCCSVRCPQRILFGGFSAEDSELYSVWQNAIVIENTMNPDSAHFAHGAVGNNSRVFNRNVSLIIEPI